MGVTFTGPCALVNKPFDTAEGAFADECLASWKIADNRQCLVGALGCSDDSSACRGICEQVAQFATTSVRRQEMLAIVETSGATPYPARSVGA